MSGTFQATTTTGGTGSFPKSVCIEEFRAGVTACLRSWSALRAAAESGWGGTASLQKAEDLRNIIYSIMDFSSFPPKNYIDVQDLQDNLFDFMEAEFSVVLEDASDRQVADVLWRMYEACYNGDVTLARQIVASAGVAESLMAAYPVKVLTTEQDDDDDDDDLDDAETADDSNDQMQDLQDSTMMHSSSGNSSKLVSTQEYACSSLFGPTRKTKQNVDNKPVRQLGQTEAEKAEMQVDEEGFAPVTARRRKQRMNSNEDTL
jgi:pre-rRNA-processing protein TSR2